MGILADYDPLDDISNRVAIPSLVFAIITPLFVLARCICGRVSTEKLWADDYLIIAAAGLVFFGVVVLLVACSWGMGKHQDALLNYPEPDKLPFGNSTLLIEKTLLLFFVDQVIYQVVMGFFKIAVLVWYVRIFETDNKKNFRMICWGLVAAIVTFTVASAFATIFQCTPIKVAWKLQLLPSECVNREAYWNARAYFNIVTYFVVTVLPMPSIFGIPRFVDGIQMKRAQKIWLCMLFGTGLFVCITAILRVQYIGLAAFGKDRTWNPIDFIMWSVIEDNLGIICACLPTMARPTATMLSRMSGYGKVSSRSSSSATLLSSRKFDDKPRGKSSRSTTESSGVSEGLEV